MSDRRGDGRRRLGEVGDGLGGGELLRRVVRGTGVVQRLPGQLTRRRQQTLAAGPEVVPPARLDPAAQLRALIEFHVDFALGNPALTRHQPFERHLRDVLCVRVHPPQEDAALLAAGRRLLLP